MDGAVLALLLLLVVVWQGSSFWGGGAPMLLVRAASCWGVGGVQPVLHILHVLVISTPSILVEKFFLLVGLRGLADLQMLQSTDPALGLGRGAITSCTPKAASRSSEGQWLP